MSNFGYLIKHFLQVGYSMKLVFIITGMSLGGAENMLLKLASNLPTSCFEIRIVSLTTGGELKESFLSVDEDLLELDFANYRFIIRDLIRLIRFLRCYKPNVVQTWMYHADLVGGICAKLARVKRVFWSIRNSTLDNKLSNTSTRLIVYVSAFLSHVIPTNIVSCSVVARDVHCKIGYSPKKFRIIPNGFDLKLFSEKKLDVETLFPRFLGKRSTINFCFIARFDPQKNHLGFLESFRLLVDKFPNAKLSLIGSGCDKYNYALTNKISTLNLESNCILLGARSDVSELIKSFDYLVLPSLYGEAFPNVLGEAMASGVPCLATDVGDSKFIIGDTGFIVAPGDVALFYKAMYAACKLSASDYVNLSSKARQRVIDYFDINVVTKMFIELYQED